MANLFDRLNNKRQQLEDSPPERAIPRGPLLRPIVPPANYKSPLVEKCLSWLVNRWPANTVRTRDFMRFGPPAARNRKMLLLLVRAGIKERAFNCFLATSALAKRALDIKERLFCRFGIFRALAHFLLAAVADVRVPGMSSTPYCCVVVFFGMFSLQHLDLLITEFVSRHEDDDCLLGVLSHIPDGGCTHLC